MSHENNFHSQTVETPNPYELTGNREVFETIQASYTDLPEQQSIFEASVGQVLDNAFTPAERDTLQQAADIARWELFGAYDAPGPESLRAEQNKWIRPVRSYATSATRDNFKERIEKAIAPLLQHRQQQRLANRPAIVEAVRQAFNHLPLTDIITSFSSTSVLTQPPQSMYERIVRRSGMEGYIRKRYSISNGGDIQKCSQAARELSGRELSLEDEAPFLPPPEDAKIDDAFLKLRGYIIACSVKSARLSNPPDPSEVSLKYNDNASSESADIYDMSWGESATSLEAPEGFESIAADIGDHPQEASIDILRYFLRRLISENSLPDRPYVEFVDEVLQDCAGYYFDNLLLRHGDGSEDTYGQLGGHLLRGPVYDAGHAPRNASNSEELLRYMEDSRSVEFVSKQTILEQLCGYAGNFTSLTPDGQLRLWGWRYANEDEDSGHARQETHRLLLYERYMGMQPYILGYNLSSSKGEGLHTYETSADDPYVPCEVGLPSQKVVELAESYQQLGLTELASELLQTDQPTVRQLVRMIKRSTKYVFEGKSFEAESLQDFQASIQEGRLQVQCTGSATFLALSLEQLFGKGRARVISGKCLYTNTFERIDALGHAQTGFVVDDKVYMLDATGKLNIEGIELFADFTDRERPVITEDSQTLPAALSALTKPQVIDQAEPIKIDYQQRLTEVHANLEQYLKTTLNVASTEELYGKLLSSPNYYPMLRTIQISLDTNRQEPNLEEIATQKVFLEHLIQDEDVRKELGYQGYSTGMLTLLLNSVTAIERNLQGLRSTATD